MAKLFVSTKLPVSALKLARKDDPDSRVSKVSYVRNRGVRVLKIRQLRSRPARESWKEARERLTA